MPIVDTGSQFLSRPKERHRFRGHLDRFSSSGVTAFAGLSVANREGAESPKLNTVALCEGFGDLV